jgi:hypothetical protein
MKGDFSRIRFNPAAQYTAVLKQQGRVDLDSDANEQRFIDDYIDGLTNVDVIGPYGGPIGNAGFQIGISGNGITIGQGRYYVNGLLVENATPVSYDDQPYLYNPSSTSTNTAEELLAAVNAGTSTVQFVLEVWQRLVTGLDDNCLLEPALGQADTTARLQTVWRVIGSIIATEAIPAAELIDPANPVTLLAPCCQMLYANTATAHNGLLVADTNQTGNECGCQPIAAAGYQGLENQLYRVEIHSPGTSGSATFKWSRENASVVTQITYISGAVLTVSSLGPDANLGFQNSQWVELTDDTYTFGQPANQPGQLYQIQSINRTTLQVTLTNPVTGVDSTKNARMRRWDQSGTSATAQGVVTAATPVPLENGIEVTFAGGSYVAGDYWTIPARTADGQITWPPCGSNGNLAQSANYTRISRAPLACVGLIPSTGFVPQPRQSLVGNYTLSDCRLLFSPLTALNDEAGADAIHVSAISWANDDVMTVDALLQNGLSVTFDQATACPWGGGNFQVSMELATSVDPFAAYEGLIPGLPAPGNYPPGTNIFSRTGMALDPPLGMIVSGNLVTWIAPAATGFWQGYETGVLYNMLNTSLNSASPIGFARIRVRLRGSAVYATTATGNIYLDGSALGATGSRVGDGSPCVSLTLPSGNQLKNADFESWFYLAPSLLITSATIQLVTASGTLESNAVTFVSSPESLSSSLETTPTATSPAVAVQTVNLVITLSYPPAAATSLAFQVNYSGGSAALSIPSQVSVAAGQTTVTVAIVPSDPGVSTNESPIVETITITPAVANVISQSTFTGTAPTLVVTGSRPFFVIGPFDGISLTKFQNTEVKTVLDKAVKQVATPTIQEQFKPADGAAPAKE